MYGGSVGRRVRRRRSLIAWGIVGVIVAIAFGITRAAGEAELSRAYLDIAFDVITTEEQVAEDFSAMILGIEDYNRATMTELLQDLEAETAAMADLLDEAEPPESLSEAHLFLRIATTTWRSALSDARNGLVALADDPLDDEGLQQLQRGLIDLRVAGAHPGASAARARPQRHPTPPKHRQWFLRSSSSGDTFMVLTTASGGLP